MNRPPTIAKLPGAAGELETFAMENCSMILSNQQKAAAAATVGGGGNGDEVLIGRTYPCKTCGRKFPSFQALGGHRSSHKKVKQMYKVAVRPKIHACSVCGAEYSNGQALGGHMRSHRGLSSGRSGGATVVTTVTGEGSTRDSDVNSNEDEEKQINNTRQYKPTGKEKRKRIETSDEPMLKKSSSSKRVCMDLDLTLRLWIKEDKEQDVNETEEEQDVNEVEEGAIVEQGKSVKDDDVDDFLKLELGCPSRY